MLTFYIFCLGLMCIVSIVISISMYYFIWLFYHILKRAVPIPFCDFWLFYFYFHSHWIVICIVSGLHYIVNFSSKITFATKHHDWYLCFFFCLLFMCQIHSILLFLSWLQFCFWDFFLKIAYLIMENVLHKLLLITAFQSIL